METKKIITTKLSVSPQHLNADLNEIIKDRLEELYLNACPKEYGYILEISRIISFGSNVISRISSLPVFTVEFEIRNLKPEVGDKISAVVKGVNPTGVVVKIKDRINGMISAANLKESGLIYNSTGVCFKNKNTSVRSGDVISLEISSVKYQGEYICLGKDVKTHAEEYKKTSKEAGAKNNKKVVTKVRKKEAAPANKSKLKDKGPVI